MENEPKLSPYWKHATILTIIFGFTVLIWLATRTVRDAPPIPERVLAPTGEVVFTGDDILSGQQVFLKYGLMEYGTIWGHGAYLGPDFTAEYLHTLTKDAGDLMASQRYQRSVKALGIDERGAIAAEVEHALKGNRYDPLRKTLRFTEAEVASFHHQIEKWQDYFSQSPQRVGLPANFLKDPAELRQLTAFFAWTAWAAAANRPGKLHSYTNNFPYDPDAGNRPTSDVVLWSALSLIALLGGTALALFVVGRFDFLGWKGQSGEVPHVHSPLVPGALSESQRAVLKYFVVVTLLFLAQALAGAAVAHYRVEPGGFYGFDLARLFPSHILRTWHLQLAIFWVATAYVAGGLFLASGLGGTEPAGQVWGINFLFGALVVVVGGSLVGEILGINQMLGKLWFWFGHQGWEYLDLGRAWQILLAVGLVIWVVLLFRAITPARQSTERREISSLFLYAATAIPLFYLPAMFFTSRSHFSLVDTWRFWIIHLWVEGFFELFVTVMVAAIFFRLGIVSQVTATRVVYLDALLYLGSGIVGTAHHWYWTGQSHIAMALGAVFSAMEVVPLTLLTLDAWDFIKLTRSRCGTCGQEVGRTHKWTFYFLMAVGFWNFVGAGVFGFLINMPIVSYFEVGTILTPNHGHAAMMGVFGMLAIALMMFALRQALPDDTWPRVEKYVRVSFWGLNVGLALMVVTNLFPGGIMQLLDVLQHGYWHARSPEFLHGRFMLLIEWARMPADIIFLAVGVIPAVVAAVLTYRLAYKRIGGAAPVE